MGAPRVTPQEIVEMHRLYKNIGTYAGVANEIGRSPKTVARYIKMEDVPRNIQLIVEQALRAKK